MLLAISISYMVLYLPLSIISLIIYHYLLLAQQSRGGSPGIPNWIWVATRIAAIMQNSSHAINFIMYVIGKSTFMSQVSGYCQKVVHFPCFA